MPNHDLPLFFINLFVPQTIENALIPGAPGGAAVDLGQGRSAGRAGETSYPGLADGVAGKGLHCLLRRVLQRAGIGAPAGDGLRRGLTMAVMLTLLAALVACGGGSSNGGGGNQPVTISISPTNPSVQIGQTATFAATVQHTSNTAVTWLVNDVAGGNATIGTITASGVYTAPATVPDPATVTVKAISSADTTKTASTTVTITPPPPVSVDVQPPTASVIIGHTQHFTATVANATDTSVTWTVTGTGCTGATCGTITAGGDYTAPVAVPSPATVTVTATSVEDTTKSDTATVTVTAVPPVSVDMQPPTASVQTGGTQHFTATVANATNTSVTWTVSGTGCSGAACGTITADGSYTAPSTVPSPATVTVKATSVEDPSKNDTATVTITAGNPLALLNGTYVLTTIDQERNGFATGSLAFDGNGHVTGGTVDLNIPEATAQTTISSGTYTIGNDGRGRLAVTVTGVGAVHFSFVVVSPNLARIMYYESTSTGDLYGTLEKQSSTATPTGKYVFKLEGTGLTGRKGYVGVLDLTANTAVLDFTEPVPTGFSNGYGTQLTNATVTKGNADSKGRGTLSIASTPTGTMQFAYWTISATRLAIIPLDPVASIIGGTSGAKPASGGVAEKQGTIVTGNLAAGSYVFSTMGFDAAGVFDKGGRLVSTGAGTAATVTSEVGSTEGQQLDVSTTCTDVVDSAGRSDIFCASTSQGYRTYLIDANHGFTLAYSTAHLGVGDFYKQSASSYTGTDVAGNSAYVSFGDETANNATGAVTIGSTGTLSGNQDRAEDGDLTPDVAITGTYTLDTIGTGETDLTSGSASTQQRFWVVSPDRVIGFTINDSDKESFVLDRQNLTTP